MTYKILFNDAVAMTGGQPVDGQISVPQIARQMASEGATKIVVVTDDPARFAEIPLESGVAVCDRRDLDLVQRELREIRGVTVLIYDQTCAAEKRRRRKKGTFPDPGRRMVINSDVCEGCGDCGKASNCLSIVPLETELGRKRAIDQTSCNKDFSCVEGFCPNFVSVIGDKLSSQAVTLQDWVTLAQALPPPSMASLDQGPHNLLIAGVGGSGIITVGAIVAMAAHLDGHEVGELDFTALAQEGRLGDVPFADCIAGHCYQPTADRLGRSPRGHPGRPDRGLSARQSRRQPRARSRGISAAADVARRACRPQTFTVADYPLDEKGTTYRNLILQKYLDLDIDFMHHAGNSSGVVDGSAAILLASPSYVRAHGLKPRARVVAMANMGNSPTLMLNAPVPAARKVLAKAGLTLDDIDLFEINEAFAVVAEKFIRDLRLDRNKVNVNGGSIALGHPIGATGAILIGTILDELERRDLKRGLVTMCAAGGMAPAIIVERI